MLSYNLESAARHLDGAGSGVTTASDSGEHAARAWDSSRRPICVRRRYRAGDSQDQDAV